jgi:hypothetical protein
MKQNMEMLEERQEGNEKVRDKKRIKRIEIRTEELSTVFTLTSAVLY